MNKVTRREAESMVCPFQFGQKHPICIADCCMAWQWAGPLLRWRKLADDVGDDIEPPRPESVPPDWQWCGDEAEDSPGWYEPADQASGRRRGYCALISRGKAGEESA